MDRHYIGIDLGGTNLRVAVVGRDKRVRGRHEAPTLAQEGPLAVVERLAQGVRAAAASAAVPLEDVAAVGIGAPGPLDAARGVVIEAPNLPGWIDFPVARRLREATGLEVYLENDANVAGYGEFWAGAGQGARTMVLLTLGTGIGGALIVDGRLHAGPDGTAGEIGHLCVADGGRRCACGRQGCLEAYASAPSTVARFREAARLGWPTRLDAREDLSCAAIFGAAAEGDDLARHIVAETGRYLGIMAGCMANLLNPDRCVFYGGMTRAGELLMAPIREACERQSFRTPFARMRILTAALGEDAGLLGAAACAMERHGAGAAG